MVNNIRELVEVAVSIQAAPLSEEGFGRALILGTHTRFGERYRLYTDLAGMVADGFATTDQEYLDAAKLLSQSDLVGIQVSDFYVGRRAAAVAQQVTITVSAVTSSVAYTVTITDEEGLVTAYTYNSDGSATNAEISAGLAAAIDDNTKFTVTNPTATTVVIVAAVAGVPFTAVATTSTRLTAAVDVASAGVAEDLAAIEALTTDWYALLTTSRARGVITQAAAWIQSSVQAHIYLAQSSEAALLSAAYDSALPHADVGSFLKASGYTKTALWYHGTDTVSLAAASAGRVIPLDPGTETWALKQLSGVTADDLSATQRAYLTGTKTAPFGGKNVNIYFALTNSVSITERGVMASGRWIDQQRSADYLRSRISTGIVNLMLANAKIAFDDDGIGRMASVVYGVLEQAEKSGMLAASPKYVVTAPKAADISSSNKTARVLDPPITASATFSGAIHYATVNVKVSQ